MAHVGTSPHVLIEKRPLVPSFKKSALVQIAIVFLAYCVAGKLGQATASIRSGNLGPVWPAYGIALAFVLLWGCRIWLGIAAASFLIALEAGVSAPIAFGQAAGATIAAITGG